MALRVTAPTVPALRSSGLRSALPLRQCRVARVVAHASKNASPDFGFEAGKMIALTTVAGQWTMAGQASAATELSEIAAGDARVGVIVTLLVPAVGWVLFNMFAPLLNQFNTMKDQLPGDRPAPKGKKRKAAVGAIGVAGALTLLGAGSADAASELSEIAATDARFGIIALLLLPAVGWVLFNMALPLLNQFNTMKDQLPEDKEVNSKPTMKGGKKKKAVIGAIGVGGALSLLGAGSAEAASELSQIAASDGRGGLIALMFLPAVTWVTFNMFQPANAQFKNMADKLD